MENRTPGDSQTTPSLNGDDLVIFILHYWLLKYALDQRSGRKNQVEIRKIL